MTLIFETVHGSHLYGIAHEGSDRDEYRVFEGTGRALTQSVRDGVDTVSGDLDAFLTRAFTGSHQSVEALFSREKAWGTGMEERWGAYLSGLRITGAEVFSKYERTIKKFSFGDFKRRRHAVRLSYNLRDLRKFGMFDPCMTDFQIEMSNVLAEHLAGIELWEALSE